MQVLSIENVMELSVVPTQHVVENLRLRKPASVVKQTVKRQTSCKGCLERISFANADISNAQQRERCRRNPRFISGSGKLPYVNRPLRQERKL